MIYGSLLSLEPVRRGTEVFQRTAATSAGNVDRTVAMIELFGTQRPGSLIDMHATIENPIDFVLLIKSDEMLLPSRFATSIPAIPGIAKVIIVRRLSRMMMKHDLPSR